MTKKAWYALFLFFCFGSMLGQDSARFLRMGIIPYQLFSRSTGAYVGYDLNRWASLEYRPTYTIATGYINSSWSDDNTIFYYQGINNNLIMHLKLSEKWKIGFMAGYRYWWFNQQRILANGYATWESFGPKELESGNKSGFFGGIEFVKYIGDEKSDAALFINFSLTKFSGTMIIYPQSNQTTAPSTIEKHGFSSNSFNVAIGLKIGYKKKLH